MSLAERPPATANILFAQSTFSYAKKKKKINCSKVGFKVQERLYTYMSHFNNKFKCAKIKLDLNWERSTLSDKDI